MAHLITVLAWINGLFGGYVLSNGAVTTNLLPRLGKSLATSKDLFTLFTRSPAGPLGQLGQQCR